MKAIETPTLVEANSLPKRLKFVFARVLPNAR